MKMRYYQYFLFCPTRAHFKEDFTMTNKTLSMVIAIAGGVLASLQVGMAITNGPLFLNLTAIVTVALTSFPAILFFTGSWK